MKTATIVDTNVFISALGWGGNARKIMKLWGDNKIKIITSVDVLNELREVLFRKKFNFINKEDKNELLFLLSEYSEIWTVKSNIKKSRDTKDDMILNLANDAKVDFIITGDEDLLVLKKHGKTKIVTPKQFLEYF